MSKKFQSKLGLGLISGSFVLVLLVAMFIYLIRTNDQSNCFKIWKASHVQMKTRLTGNVYEVKPVGKIMEYGEETVDKYDFKILNHPIYIYQDTYFQQVNDLAKPRLYNGKPDIVYTSRQGDSFYLKQAQYTMPVHKSIRIAQVNNLTKYSKNTLHGWANQQLLIKANYPLPGYIYVNLNLKTYFKKNPNMQNVDFKPNTGNIITLDHTQFKWRTVKNMSLNDLAKKHQLYIGVFTTD